MRLRKIPLLVSTLIISTPLSANLLISEVLYDAPNSDALEEFVELVNTSCDPVDLSQYQLKDNSGSFQLSGSVAGGEYWIIAKDEQAFSQLFGFSPQQSGMSLALGNSGDRVELVQQSSLVDQVAWEGHLSGWNIAAKDVSIYRNNTIDSDNVNDWSVSTSTGEPDTGVFDSCQGGGGGTPTLITLTDGQTVNNLSAATNEELTFSIDTPSDVNSLTVTVAGGTGDSDLYVRFGAEPTLTTYDCRPYLIGNSENCTFSTAQSGTYFIDLVAYEGFSGVSLTADYTQNTTPPPPPSGYDFNVYYKNAIGQTGSNLHTALNSIIKGHTVLTYSEVWDALTYTDASLTSTGQVTLLYSGRSVDNNFRAGQTNDPDAWNREHVWAKSHGFPSKSQHAYTDIHHLRPSDVTINSSRGNKDFDWGGTPLSEAPENATDSDSFEPRDAVKGDVARMVFYMDVRYNANDASGTPDLTVVNYITGTGDPLLGKVCALLTWHRNDPIDSWEQRRNDRIFEIQGNRNPFIDNPNWAEELFASQCL